MNVLVLLPGHEVGGAERAAAAICEGLAGRGDRVFVAAGGERALAAAGPLPGTTLPINPAKKAHAPKGIWRLFHLARSTNADVIYAHHRWPALLALPTRLLLGIPVVVHCHALVRRRRPTYWGDRTIAVADAVAAHIVKAGAEQEHTTVVRVAPALPFVERYEIVRVRKRIENALPRSRGRFAVVVSRLAEEKNIEDVLLALIDTDVHLAVIGDGPDRDRLERMALDLGISTRVFFAGWVEHPAPYFAAAEFSVIASTAEGIPLAALESLAQGCPVIASDVGGMGELLGAGRGGVLVPVNDVDALAASMRELHGDATLRGSLAQTASNALTACAGRQSTMVSRIGAILTEVVRDRPAT